ncbi:MAG: C4-dicarboxylate ABC transporter substrate-binding protein [Myxococcales bacterium]|nr:C4-dicarboxylate ABC transporter substrate-binding protein [Myxococcales bacterium]
MRFRRLAGLLFATFAFAAAPRPASAEVEIKLGTLAPAGSSWHTLLKEMGQKWAEVSGGQVKLRIYPGGVVGNEGEMVRKMRVGQLQGAALTTVGLHDITPEPQAVGVPLAIASYEELDYVMGKLEGTLNQSLEAKGYVALNWADVGFVRFFSTHAIRTPTDLKGAKLFAWDGDPKSVEAWKAAGFSPVVLSSTDIIPSLQTGMVDTVATAPLYALTSRIYQKANKMSELRWALLTGATVVKKDVWDKVPADLRPKLIAIAREIGKRIDAEIRKMNDDAVAQMKAKGLEVVKAEDPAAWEKAAAEANKVVRGGVVPAAAYDQVIKLRDEYRATKGKK